MADFAVRQGIGSARVVNVSSLDGLALDTVRIAQLKPHLVGRGWLQVHDAAGEAFGDGVERPMIRVVEVAITRRHFASLADPA